MSPTSTENNDAAACEFCQLPLPATNGSPYCCYGCEFAASLAAAQGDEGQSRWIMIKLGLAVFFAMNVMVCTLLLWSEPTDPAGELAHAWYGLFRYAALLFTLPVVLLLGAPLFASAGQELQHGRISMTPLLSLGVLAALLYSVYSLLTGGHVYFEVACAILIAVTFGKWLEAQGKLQATQALQGLAKLLPEQVRLVRANLESLVDIHELQVGDSFRVLPGERIVADGVIDAGEALVDEQVVTGESLPRTKVIGDRVFSGALVVDGPLLIRAAATADQGMIARMIAAVREGAQAKSQYEALADRVSRWFAPAVIVIAMAVLFGHWRTDGLERGLLAAVAVLVIACPCSLALATPLAHWAAIGRAAECGILIRHGDAFTRFASAQTICFDKTGTLTTGIAQVSELRCVPEESLRSIASRILPMVRDSEHPLSSAVRLFLTEQAVCCRTHSYEAVRAVAGRGLIGSTSNAPAVFFGSRRWMLENGQDCHALQIAETDDAAETLVAWDGRVRGQFLCSEQLRPEAAATIDELRQTGLQPLVLTGDRHSRAKRLAAELDVAFEAELLPEEKLQTITKLPNRPVAMVGDGINDAPALAAADIGIALGSGCDISRHAAAICLLGSNLSSLVFLRRLACRTVSTMRWNLFWSLAYNVIGLSLAAAGWLHPAIAAIAMGASGLLVVANSLALARFEKFGDVESGDPNRITQKTTPPLYRGATT